MMTVLSKARRMGHIAGLVAIALIGVGTLPMTTALAAEGPSSPGPTMADPTFDGQSWDRTQHYHAAFVTPGADGTASAVRIGLDYPDGSDYPTGGNLPTKNQMPGRGMVNKIVSGVEPNTTYTFTLKVKGPNVQYGIFDVENSPYYKGYAPGARVSYTDWTEVSSQITTGPRTTELNAFCLTYDNAGPNYCDDFSVVKTGTAATPQAAPATWSKDLAAAATVNGFPTTIPAVQAFTPAASGRGWQIPDRIGAVVVPMDQYADLRADAETLSAEIAKVFGAPVSVIKGTPGKMRKLAANDIVYSTGPLDESTLSAKAKAQIGSAYTIDIAAGEPLRVTGGGAAGAFYGMQTILQAVQGNDRLPAGQVFDWTDQEVRGLQVDAARRYYSTDWLKQEITDLAYTKLNYMTIRIKDSEGLRVQSDVAPELTDNLPDGGSWSKAEVADLVAFAKKYHVTIIPELDMPGHALMDNLVYPDKTIVTGSGEGYIAYDYTKPEVRQFLTDLAREMGNTFDSPYVHLGGDEFFGHSDKHFTDWIKTIDPKATSTDAYRYLFNEVNAGLKKDGRSAWMWNDMLDTAAGQIPLDPSITVAFWAKIYQSMTAKQMVDAGFRLVGSSSDLYHDLWPATSTGSTNNTINQPLPEYMWSTYDSPYVYSGGFGPPSELAPDSRSTSIGQLFPIWDDAMGWAPEYVLTQTLLPRLRIHAQTLWNSPRTVDTYAQFDPFVQHYGHSPVFQVRTQTQGNYTLNFAWPADHVTGKDTVTIPAGGLSGFEPNERIQVLAPDGTVLAVVKSDSTGSSAKALKINFPKDNFGIPDGEQRLTAKGASSGRYIWHTATFTAEG